MSKTFPLIKNALDPFYYGNGEDLEDYKKRWHYVSGDWEEDGDEWGPDDLIREFTFQHQSGSDFEPYTAYFLNEDLAGDFGYLRNPGKFFIKEGNKAKLVSGETLLANSFSKLSKEHREHFIPAILTHPYFALDKTRPLGETRYKELEKGNHERTGKWFPLGLVGSHKTYRFDFVLPRDESPRPYYEGEI